MTDDAEWGPWIEHDGRGCPCVGQLVESTQRNGTTEIHIADNLLVLRGKTIGSAQGLDVPSAWVWGSVPKQFEVIRYRIRKPRALKQLRDLVENLPAPTERVDA